MKVCAIHQPNYLPYLGYFQKYLKSDVFVIYDSAQYTKNDWRNRNRVKTANGATWLTVPVQADIAKSVKEQKVAGKKFIAQHLKTLEVSYKKAPHFAQVFPEVENWYAHQSDWLVDYIYPCYRYLFPLVKPGVDVRYSSDMDLGSHHSTEALVAIAKLTGCTAYLAGKDGANYMDTSLFEAAGVALLWQHFEPNPYPQLWGGEFEPYLSAVDALFNVGPEGIKQLL